MSPPDNEHGERYMRSSACLRSGGQGMHRLLMYTTLSIKGAE